MFYEMYYALEIFPLRIRIHSFVFLNVHDLFSHNSIPIIYLDLS